MAAPLTDGDLDEIERLALRDAAEAYRGPLLALVGEVLRLRDILQARRAVRSHGAVTLAGNLESQESQG